VAWHSNKTCEEYQEQREKDDLDMTTELADKNGWRRCNTCGCGTIPNTFSLIDRLPPTKATPLSMLDEDGTDSLAVVCQTLFMSANTLRGVQAQMNDVVELAC
jgi:hypothetical protein